MRIYLLSMISNLRNKRERKYQRVHLFPRKNFEVHVRPYSSQIAENTDVHGLRHATFQGSIEISDFPWQGKSPNQGKSRP